MLGLFLELLKLVELCLRQLYLLDFFCRVELSALEPLSLSDLRKCRPRSPSLLKDLVLDQLCLDQLLVLANVLEQPLFFPPIPLGYHCTLRLWPRPLDSRILIVK